MLQFKAVCVFVRRYFWLCLEQKSCRRMLRTVWVLVADSPKGELVLARSAFGFFWLKGRCCDSKNQNKHSLMGLSQWVSSLALLLRTICPLGMLASLLLQTPLLSSIECACLVVREEGSWFSYTDETLPGEPAKVIWVRDQSLLFSL